MLKILDADMHPKSFVMFFVILMTAKSELAHVLLMCSKFNTLYCYVVFSHVFYAYNQVLMT